jgi:arylsulfatase A-like enzyme
MTDLLSGHAVEFARKKRDKPFCLYLAHKAVHGPFTPAARHKDLFTDKTVQRGANAEDNFEGRPALASLQSDRRYNPNDELVRNQLRCLASIDDGVGELMKAVPEHTLFIFTSDNGYFWGDHKLGDKRWAYEESVRIPMIARWPGHIKAGSEITANALNIDIGPTMLDAGGAPRAAAMQGRSLLPLFQGKPKQWRKTFFTEYFRDGNFPQPPWQAVQDDRWKYIHYTEKPEWDELYDRKSDPHELKNLIADPAAAKELARLKKELAALV